MTVVRSGLSCRSSSSLEVQSQAAMIEQAHRNDQSEGQAEIAALHEATQSYVKAYMSRYDCSHDFSHVSRVLALAQHILAGEVKIHPAKYYNQQIVILAALLHDVGDHKYTLPGENSENLITDHLLKHGCSAKQAEEVKVVVDHVSFSNEIKHPQLVQAVLTAHPELAIVQDADRLDAIGAVGIGRCFAYGAAKQPDRGLEGSILHFGDKLELLESMMKTETGRKLAKERTARLREFRRWWQEEHDITVAGIAPAGNAD